MDLVGIGELLIDFTPTGGIGSQSFQQNAGGAPGNMLTAAQKMGSKTAFIGKVGDDQFGRFLKETLDAEGVSTEGLVLSKEDPTTLAFVHLDAHGDRDFSFYRKGCADVMLREDEIPYPLIDRAKALHFGSLSFTNEPSRSAVLSAVAYAKEKGKLVTYDPNYRPPLWETEATALHWMKEGLKWADVVKVSDDEARLLTGESDLTAAAKRILAEGVQLVAITLGPEGSLYAHRSGCGVVPGYRSKVVDTTGAGDSFFGTLIHQIVDSGKSVDQLEEADLKMWFQWSNAVASLCIEQMGGIPSMPTREPVLQRIQQQSE